MDIAIKDLPYIPSNYPIVRQFALYRRDNSL